MVWACARRREQGETCGRGVQACARRRVEPPRFSYLALGVKPACAQPSADLLRELTRDGRIARRGISRIARFVGPLRTRRGGRRRQDFSPRRRSCFKIHALRRIGVGLNATCRSPHRFPAGFRFHDLRHTANTITAAVGASTRELMHRMGHASPEAALRYQHATRARDAELAAVLGDLVKDAKPARAAPSARSTRDGADLCRACGRTRPSRIRSDLRTHTERRRESNPRSQVGNPHRPVIGGRHRT